MAVGCAAYLPCCGPWLCNRSRPLHPQRDHSSLQVTRGSDRAGGKTHKPWPLFLPLPLPGVTTARQAVIRARERCLPHRETEMQYQALKLTHSEPCLVPAPLVTRSRYMLVNDLIVVEAMRGEGRAGALAIIRWVFCGTTPLRGGRE
ncbi:hypothetical protein E2C01_046941 [Portunus trituberculatus]|uniref:Uncharacterized protein n=1 Tax=Portunus trituberculatus TaxID=210409 RepID=A0A5B7G687_PORTR|nr:hypothetical protein [Portunus trituberculatus]